MSTRPTKVAELPKHDLHTLEAIADAFDQPLRTAFKYFSKWTSRTDFHGAAQETVPADRYNSLAKTMHLPHLTLDKAA